jgi:hypothetical protein
MPRSPSQANNNAEDDPRAVSAKNAVRRNPDSVVVKRPHQARSTMRIIDATLHVILSSRLDDHRGTVSYGVWLTRATCTRPSDGEQGAGTTKPERSDRQQQTGSRNKDGHGASVPRERRKSG